MSAPVPIPIYPWPLSPERLALLKEAKASIDTQQQIYPAEAHPASPGRIFAWGEVAPIWAEQVLIAPENVDNPDSIRAALDFWLHGNDQPATVSEESWLKAILGEGTRLLYEEAVDAPVQPDTLRTY